MVRGLTRDALASAARLSAFPSLLEAMLKKVIAPVDTVNYCRYVDNKVFVHMSARQHWPQLTLFDDLEVPLPVSVESPTPFSPNQEQVGQVPAIDVSRVRRRRTPNQPELDGLH
jgi:hypothetical protein